MSRLDQAIEAQREALRGLAGVLARATLGRDDNPSDVVDMLLEAGFPEETDDDTRLLDRIDPAGSDERREETGEATR